MEIYTFDTPIYRLLNILYAVGAIGFAILLTVIIVFIVGQVKAYRHEGQKLPKRLIVFFAGLVLVPLVGCLGFSNLLIQNAVYVTDMENGNAQLWCGDVTVVSCEAHDYRGEFMGYKVVLSLDGQTLSPSNAFPEDVVDVLKSDREVIIQYDEIPNDGIYVWSIKTMQEE